MWDQPREPEEWLRKHMCHGQDIMTSRRQEQSRPRLRSAVESLNQLLSGGFLPGSLVEWGLPPGRRGHECLLTFLRTGAPLTLWTYGGPLRAYPPAWVAQGADLRRIYFAKSSRVLQELRPVFLEPLFGLVVLDHPTALRREDLVFLSQQARKTGQTIFLVRPFFLSQQQGTPQARYRLNCWFDHWKQAFCLELLKGGLPSSLSLQPAQLAERCTHGKP